MTVDVYRPLSSCVIWGSNVTVVAFIITPAQTHSYTIDSLKGQAITKQLKDTVTEIQNRIGARLFDMVVHSNGLFNAAYDRVKVVFHPDFLNANNPVLGMDYEEFVRGCHLGVFPSYYKPWGYTPAECTVLMGIPSITTNLSSFGCFMQDMIERPDDEGCYIVDRRMKSLEHLVNELAEHIFSFTLKTR
ncbi:glycogen synthase [Lactarius hatsudake]|nr:glycogen synthase [Lactarius hatsudake]